MPLHLQDKSTGEIWVALRHAGNNPGPNGRIRTIDGTIDGSSVVSGFCLGAARQLTTTGKWRFGNRVNFKYNDSWWKITEGEGNESNLYLRILNGRTTNLDLTLDHLSN